MLLALLQFAFVFQAWITLNSAIRDAARDAALYVYDPDRYVVELKFYPPGSVEVAPLAD